MPDIRYEEHIPENDKLPFLLYMGIVVTPSRFSDAANWHDNLEIQLCTEGDGIVSMDGQTREVTAGDVVVVNTNVIHHMQSQSRVKYTCLIVDRDFCAAADINTHNLLFEPYLRNEKIARLFRELEATYKSTEDVCRVAKLQDIVLRILIALRTEHTVVEDGAHAVKKDVFLRVKNTIKYIRENYSRKMSLDEIAKNVITDKYVLSREFKKSTGQTILEYINCYRCKMARDFIKGGATVGEAARRCGFDNMSFFTKTFKHYIGKLPSKYK